MIQKFDCANGCGKAMTIDWLFVVPCEDLANKHDGYYLRPDGRPAQTDAECGPGGVFYPAMEYWVCSEECEGGQYPSGLSAFRQFLGAGRST